MKYVILFLLVLLPGLATANQWRTSEDRDTFTESVSNHMWSVTKVRHRYGDRWAGMGFRCDHEDSLMLVAHAGGAIGVPGSAFTLQIKIPDHNVFHFPGKLYSNSYESGYVTVTPNNKATINILIDAMKKGHSMAGRISNDRRSEIIDFELSLVGFTRASVDVLKGCASFLE